MRRELLTLSKVHSDLVARHLVMTGELLGVQPELAYAHAQAARRFGSRLAVVREASGIAAYGAGKYGEALADLRAYRRMSGRLDHLPMEADCERGLGRPDRALAVASTPEAQRLDVAARAELRMVVSGARRDLGQPEAAVTALQTPELRRRVEEGWWARLAYAYAEALLEVGRRDEAMTWFGRSADADREGDTDAAERLAELEGFSFAEIAEDDEAGAFDERPPRGSPSRSTRPTLRGRAP